MFGWQQAGGGGGVSGENGEMEKPPPAGTMCKPCLWAIIFPSLKMNSVLQAAKYKHMSTNTDNTIFICPLPDKARSPGDCLFLYKMKIHYHMY